MRFHKLSLTRRGTDLRLTCSSGERQPGPRCALRRLRRDLIGGLILGMVTVALVPNGPSAVASATSARIAGPTRDDTAAAIAEHAYPSGAQVVYLAGDDGSPDALAAGSLKDGPVLLVPPQGPVAPSTSTAISQLSPQTVVALGGPAAVSDQTLEVAAGGRATSRIAGPTRDDTTAAIAEHAYPSGAQVVYLAGDDGSPDALAAGSLKDGPVLLVPSCGDLPDPSRVALNVLQPATVTALGGSAAVCDDELGKAGVASGQSAVTDTDTTPSNASTQVTTWPSDHITYQFLNGSTSYQAAVTAAFSAWSQVANVTFTPVATGATPDITVDWYSGCQRLEPSQPCFDGPGGVLAEATVGYAPGGWIAFDASEPWSVGGALDLQTVATHESGHVLGLEHVPDKTSVMYPYYQGIHHAILGDDVTRIQALYGPPSNPPSAPPGSTNRYSIVSYDRMTSGAPHNGYFNTAFQSFTAASNTITDLGVTVGNTTLPPGATVPYTVPIRLCTDPQCSMTLGGGQASIVNFGDSSVDIGDVHVTPGTTYYIHWDQPVQADGSRWVTYWWAGGTSITTSDQMQARVVGYNR